MEIGRALEGELQGRQLANLKQNATDVENFPPREIPVGKTRDLAAKAAGFGKAFPRARGGHHGFNRQRCRLMAAQALCWCWPRWCKNPAPVATWWLHAPEKEKPRYVLSSRASLRYLAPRPGLEPGTYGLTVRRSTD